LIPSLFYYGFGKVKEKTPTPDLFSLTLPKTQTHKTSKNLFHLKKIVYAGRVQKCLLAGLLGKSKPDRVWVGKVVHDVFALAPVDSEKTEVDATANVLQAADAHLGLGVVRLRHELAAGRVELLSVNDDGPARGLAIAGNDVDLIVFLEKGAGDVAVKLGDDIWVGKGNGRGRVKMDVHLPRSDLGVGVEAEALGEETVCRPVFLPDVVDPGNGTSHLVLVEEAKVEDGTALLPRVSKYGLGELAFDVVEECVLDLGLDEVVGPVAESHSAVHMLVRQRSIGDA
jgi:hypothetical protein